jgi:hypothetical protein
MKIPIKVEGFFDKPDMSDPLNNTRQLQVVVGGIRIKIMWAVSQQDHKDYKPYIEIIGPE